MYKNDNITFHSHHGWVFKVIKAVSAVIRMELEPISPVWYQSIGTNILIGDVVQPNVLVPLVEMTCQM